MTITSIQTGTNSDLVDVARQLYPLDGAVLDLTPGKNLGFWKKYRPEGLDLLHEREDFRQTLYGSGTFDAVVFDPPYVAKGGHSTSTITHMNERYGMLHVERNPMEQWAQQIRPGIREAHRLLKPKGLLWLKCMDYVTGGKVHWFTKIAYLDLIQIGFNLEDEFILNGRPGPQPTVNRDGTRRRQVHARRAHSVLMIARKR